MNKRAFTLEGFVVTLLVISTLAAGFFIVINEQIKTYGVQIDTTLNTTFIHTEKLQNTTEQVRASVFGAEVESDTAENSLFRAAFKTTKIVGLSFSIFTSLINDMFKALPFPDDFGLLTLILVGVLVTLLFAILRAVLIRTGL